MNIHQALAYGEAMLHEYGIRDPRWNTERLLRLALRIDRARFFSDLHAELSAEQESSYRALLSRRAVHYPLAYLEGVQEFYGREFVVNESVLIPRPETEEIVGAVLDLPLQAYPLILDVGAGSGAIAVTLSHEIPGSRIAALEISSFALILLKQNAQGRVNLVRGDFHRLPFRDGIFDVVVSNPPYVEFSEYDQLPAETRWEPRDALVAADIKEVYEALLKSSLRVLKSGGFLVFEIGYGQSEQMKSLCQAYPAFTVPEIRRDHQGIPRTFALKKR